MESGISMSPRVTVPFLCRRRSIDRRPPDRDGRELAEWCNSRRRGHLTFAERPLSARDAADAADLRE